MCFKQSTFYHEFEECPQCQFVIPKVSNGTVLKTFPPNDSESLGMSEGSAK